MRPQGPPGRAFLFPGVRVILHIREKIRKTDRKRILSGSIYFRGFRWTDRGNTFHTARQRRLKVWALYTLPREVVQISCSDAIGHISTDLGAARYFDYGSAVALRNLAAAYGTDMPRYLLTPEVAVLLSKVADLKKRLFIGTQWNTGGRLNEILPLAREDFVLDDPLSGAPLSSPFVVLRTLKQRRLEEAARSRSRRRDRPAKEQQQAERDAGADIRDSPPRAVPLTDPGFVQRLRGMVCDGAAGHGTKERGYSALLDLLDGCGRRARRRDVFHPSGDAQNVQGLVCHAPNTAHGAAEGHSDADGAQVCEVRRVVYPGVCAGHHTPARRAALHGSG